LDAVSISRVTPATYLASSFRFFIGRTLIPWLFVFHSIDWT
jgi:hypothetical protein